MVVPYGSYEVIKFALSLWSLDGLLQRLALPRWQWLYYWRSTNYHNNLTNFSICLLRCTSMESIRVCHLIFFSLLLFLRFFANNKIYNIYIYKLLHQNHPTLRQAIMQIIEN